MRALLLCVLALSACAYGSGNDSGARIGDQDCADFDTQAEADRFFREQGGPERDPHTLDADRDGIPCEWNR